MEEVQEKDSAEQLAEHAHEVQEAQDSQEQGTPEVTGEPASTATESLITDEAPIAEEDFDSDDVMIAEAVTEPAAPTESNAASVKAVIEAAIYITDEPLSAEQIAVAIEQPLDRVREILAQLVTEYSAPDRGLSIREIAGGYKMSTKPEHHESIRRFVKGLQAPLKLSLAALETLAVIAYRQPITGPEVLDVRGVQGAGVLKTLLDRKLIAAAGRKNVLGKPMMYKTTREFLIQFGLNTLAELPTLKEFEELGRMAIDESELPPQTELPLRPGLPLSASEPVAAAAAEPVAREALPHTELEPESHDA